MGLIKRFKHRREKKKELTPFGLALAKTFATTSKQLLWIFSLNGVAWIWCSYVLAFQDKAQIAEALSSNVCTVIIGQMGFYLITKTIENVFQYNDLFGKRQKYTGEGAIPIEDDDNKDAPKDDGPDPNMTTDAPVN